MGDMIVTEQLTGNTVYGVKQVQYTVDGVSGQDFTKALTEAAFKEAVAIESAAGGYSEVVKARQRKVSDLGDVLSILTECYAKLRVKDGKHDDKISITNAAWVNGITRYYGITLVFVENTDQMTRSNLMKGQTNVEYAIDKENNRLQQDMVSLQSYISKRDNAFSTASKIVRKSNNAASSTINNMGS